MKSLPTSRLASLFRVGALPYLLAVAAVALPVGVTATTINFDDFTVTGGTSFASSTRYQGIGAIFSRDIPIEHVAIAEPGNLADFVTLGGTTPNALALNTALGSQIDLMFVLPGTFTPATTDSVQVLFFDTEIGSTLGTIQAFDINNNLIATRTMTTPASKGAVLEVNTSGITRVRFSVDADGADLDNLVFAPVPEPSSALMLVAGLGAFGLFARRLTSKQ